MNTGFWWGKLKGMSLLGIALKWILKKACEGPDWIDIAPAAGCCEHGSKLTVSIKRGECLY
jgi:hypothetical protein